MYTSNGTNIYGTNISIHFLNISNLTTNLETIYYPSYINPVIKLRSSKQINIQVTLIQVEEIYYKPGMALHSDSVSYLNIYGTNKSINFLNISNLTTNLETIYYPSYINSVIKLRTSKQINIQVTLINPS